MLYYVARRVAAAGLMLIALSVLMFGLLRMTPGDPVSAYIDPAAPMTEADVAALRHRLGLDRSLPVQYLAWAEAAIHGDLGYSTQHERAPVRALVAERAGPTLLLMGSGLLLATIGGLCFGIISAVRANTLLDVVLASLSALGISAPVFLVALIGLFVFAVRLGWAPAGGIATPGVPLTPGDVLAHLVLPASVFAITQMTMTMRFMRGALLEALGQDYVRTARAKGVAEVSVILKHALRNALLPVVTLVGASLGAAVGGAIFIESVFNWPGMGLLLVNAVEARDYPLIMGAALVIGACVLIVNLLTDLLYAAIDPRIALR
ncbi:MAG: ABC transporter permease [Acetobacteraceae bacterium]|jgi:peptide/nickel transport system permease protein